MIKLVGFAKLLCDHCDDGTLKKGVEFLSHAFTTRPELCEENGRKFIKINGAEFSLERMLRLLTRDDLIRADGLAKSFKNEAPRAVATLAIAKSLLEKSK